MSHYHRSTESPSQHGCASMFPQNKATHGFKLHRPCGTASSRSIWEMQKPQESKLTPGKQQGFTRAGLPLPGLHTRCFTLSAVPLGCSQKTRNYLGAAGMHLLRNQAFIFLQPAGLNHVLSLLSATKSQFQRNAYPVCNYASENGDRNTTTPRLCWGAEVPPVFRQTSPFPCHKPVPAQSPWVAPPESPGVGHNLLPQAAPIGMTNTLASEQTAP